MALKNNALSISKSLQEPSPSYNNHISKYFTKQASVTALPLQTKNPTASWMTCSRPPKHTSARAGYRVRFPSSKSAPQLALVASLKHLLVCTKNMCFVFKREWTLQIKHLGGGEMGKLLTEVHSCIDIFLLLAPIFHTAFFIC